MGKLGHVFHFGWKYLRRYWGRLVAGILFGIVFGLSNASFVWATKTLMARLTPANAEAVETAVPGEPAPAAKGLQEITSTVARIVDPWLPRIGERMDWRRILGALLFLPLLVSIRSIADFFSSYCMGWVSERVINDMRLDVLGKLSALSLDFFNRATTGDLFTRVNADTASLLRCLRVGASGLVKEGISVISLLAALLWINWQLTLFAMVFLPLCMFPLLVLGRKVRKAAKGARGTEILQASQLVELLASIRIIKAFSLESEQMQRYRALSRQLVRHGMRGIKSKELVNPIIEVVSMLGLGALIVYIFMSQTSIADFVGFLTAVMLFFLSIKRLATVHMLFEQASPGVDRMIEILQEQPTVTEPLRPQPLKSFRSDIRFANVSFGYNPDRTVIQDFNLVIGRGEKIGLAGPSGSGKSTLVNLLFRFYDPTSGAIRIDGIDLREVSLFDLRQLMALVSQEVVLFDQSIAENIACGKAGATRAEVEAAARAANANDFIAQLPAGYDSRAGERGVTLSGGQRQRIAIARAFIRNAPILVLDEATASLDSQAEAEVQGAIERLSENRTVICVAHRLSTLASCDRIIVLSEGCTIEEGGFQELLERGGAFASMARRQGLSATSGVVA